MSDHIEKPWQEIKPNTNSPQVNFWKCVINKQENFNIDQPSRDTSIQSFMNLSLPEIRTFILIQKQYIYTRNIFDVGLFMLSVRISSVDLAKFANV